MLTNLIPLTPHWPVLFHQLMKEQTSARSSLWSNHVLTVLIEINVQTTEPTAENFNDWIIRLTRYIQANHRKGLSDSPATHLAVQLKLQLEAPPRHPERARYHLLRTTNHIRRHFYPYLQQIEDSGHLDASLSLLIAYLRGYAHIARAFNQRFETLPEHYFHNILHATTQPAVPDSVYIFVRPTSTVGEAFTLPAGTSFTAGETSNGEPLMYQTLRPERITPLQCVEFLSVNPHSPDAPPQGWIIESPMLALTEGERHLSVRFRLTDTEDHTLPTDQQLNSSFTLQLQHAEDWIEYPCTVTINSRRQLCFDLHLIPADATGYSALRILTTREPAAYYWAASLQWDAIEIYTCVSGIRHFDLSNEQGEADTTQPFYPFGMQPDKGAWFHLTNQEIGDKFLQELRLTGDWMKLPATEAELTYIYKEYTSATGQTISASTFTLGTEWRQAGKWQPCSDDGGTQPLFIPDQQSEERSLTRAEIVIRPAFKKRSDGHFRVTLLTPTIGFGAQAYRHLYAETMMHNSCNKEKKHKAMPAEPAIPLLADAELSYIATEETTLAAINQSGIRLSRIAELPGQDPLPIRSQTAPLPLLPASPTRHRFYLAFLYAQGEQSIRMYFDTILPSTWEYRQAEEWYLIAVEDIHIEGSPMGGTRGSIIEIRFPEPFAPRHVDKQGRVWLRATLSNDDDTTICPPLVLTNCILLTALNGDGTPLSPDTIEAPVETDPRIENIAQPFSGFGGRLAETEQDVAERQVAHISHRHRAITARDYERLVRQYFPDIEQVQCLSVWQEAAPPHVTLVVFSPADDNRRYLSPAWKLAAIQRYISQCTSPFVRLQVVNPDYEPVEVYCKAILWDNIEDRGTVLRQLTVLAQNHIAPWLRKGQIPTLGHHLSYKELHTRLVNHEAIMKLVTLQVNGKSLPHVDVDTPDITIPCRHPWSIHLPRITINLLSPHDGIDKAEIGTNLIIK